MENDEDTAMTPNGSDTTNPLLDEPFEPASPVCFPGEAVLVSQLPCGVIAVDGDGRVAVVNVTAESL